jgi:amino acid permease
MNIHPQRLIIILVCIICIAGKIITLIKQDTDRFAQFLSIFWVALFSNWIYVHYSKRHTPIIHSKPFQYIYFGILITAVTGFAVYFIIEKI